MQGIESNPSKLGFLPELASNVMASFLYDKAVKPIVEPTDVASAAPQDVSSTVIRSEQLKHMVFTSLGLTGDWKQMLGDVAKPFAMMVYGLAGGGKSTFNLIFAKYLAETLNKRVLYVSGEEGLTATMKEKFERLRAYHPNIFISAGQPTSYNGYDIVFVDSVNYLHLSEEDLKVLLETNMPKGISFVLVFHSTKEGNYRGVATFEHLVDISMKVEAGVTSIGKNRFGGHGSMRVY